MLVDGDAKIRISDDGYLLQVCCCQVDELGLVGGGRVVWVGGQGGGKFDDFSQAFAVGDVGSDCGAFVDDEEGETENVEDDPKVGGEHWFDDLVGWLVGRVGCGC